ncbi:MAG: UDP-N-acetylmuramoyl-L-alanyl-D-glutamate--2,6-diaminopimelate ligase, partial [Paludibacteraceae bacterium]|nr:UDP-N-acetylmuramoyl-L-alanyl-D-glutamate--2,6-diaminopimelate ligase [Paludibacteraceae bacterium]
MKLTELISNLEYESIRSEKDVDIKDIQFDSRKVGEGSVFVAIKGTASDGHDYIGAALKSGAVAVVYDDASKAKEIGDGVVAIKVKDSSVALARLASNYYGNPSQKVTLVGVTGTNGKTTTATLLYQMFRKLGHKSGLLSTVINYIDDEAVEATHTTPDPLELNGLLARMVERGCEYVFMEVSSHSVVQNRIAYLDFDGALFTNITRDHIDYHGTFDNYLAAKKAFFDGLKKSAFAITNIDDKNGLVMLQNTAAKRMTYSTRAMADFRGKIIEESFDGMLISVNDTEVNVPFIGRF